MVLVIFFGGVGMVLAAQGEPDGDEQPAAAPSRFLKRTYRDTQGKELPYRLLLPPRAREKSAAHPLLVFLHGRGERGTDNQAQLLYGKSMMRAAAREYGAMVVAPQCPPKKRWPGRKLKNPDRRLAPEPSEPMRMVVELIEQLKKDFRVDPDRVYVMGLSMGGFGTWEFVARWPDRVAAVVPICGGGDESRATQITRVPIWAFHGDADPVVPVARSRDMIDAIRKAGGKPKYTEYPGVGHDSWHRVFAEPGLLEWLFAQRRVPRD